MSSSFALDPSLLGHSASTSKGAHHTFDQEDQTFRYDLSDDASLDGRDEDDDDASLDEGETDETDAEEEYRTHMGESQSRRKTTKKSSTRDEKGKGRAVDPKDLDGQDGDEDSDAQEGGDDEELGRLVSAIRDSGSTSSVGGQTALNKAFDRTIEEELDGIDDPFNNALSGSKKRRQPSRRAEAEPSQEVKAMLGTANRHYAEGNLEEARSILTEVVRIDPAIRQSWMTLATIEDELGDYDKAITFQIVGTHLLPLKKAAADWATLGAKCRDNGLLHHAIYCFTQAIKGDKEDVDSMWDRAVLLKMSGENNRAITAFTGLLNIIPHDPGVLRELAPLLAATSAYPKATHLYLAAFDHYRRLVPHVSPRTIDRINTFGYNDLETIADFLTAQKLYAKCIAVIRTGVRWLQGRESETGWDALEDDREYDEVRKMRIGWEDATSKHLEQAEVYELDVRLRLRLGVARMGEGNVQEAQRHFAIVLKEDVAEFPELWGAIGDAYFDRQMYEDALEIFQEMAEDEITNGPAVWSKVGACHFENRDYEDALECFEAVMDEQPENLTVKMQLARTFEALEKPDKALELIHEIVETRRHLRETGQLEELARTPSTRAPRGSRIGRVSGASARPSLTPAERLARRANLVAAEEQRHLEFSMAMQTLRKLDARVDDGDADAITEWLEVATFLVDAFRETKALFPSDTKAKFRGVLSRQWKRKGGGEMDLERQANEMASRLERSMIDDGDEQVEVDSFRGIHFDEWLGVIMKYSFLLIKNDESEAGLETLKHVQGASVFKQNEKRLHSLWLALMAGYSYVQNYDEIVLIIRKFSRTKQFHTEPIRMLLAFLPGGVAATEAFNAATLQKYLSRQLTMLERISRGAEVRVGVNGTIIVKSGDKAEKDDDDDDEEGEGSDEKVPDFLPTVTNPIYNFVYASMLQVSKSYQSTILYLLRAYEQMPKQPLLNLSLAIAYLHRAMTRQTDNRQHQIAQGLAFLSQYRAIRGKCQEVEYNFGRAFHTLGLSAYAIRHYEACLALAPEKMEVDEEDDDENAEDPNDFSRVAAYNLVGLYVMTGQPDLGRKIATRWLTF